VIKLSRLFPAEVSSNYELTQITLDYKRECKADDVVESLVTPENVQTAEAISWLMGPKHTNNGTYRSTNSSANGSNGTYLSESKHQTLLFLHVLRLSKEGKEINRGRTEWRRKPTPQGSH
jgi:fatty acyl-ACP thioesterase A